MVNFWLIKSEPSCYSISDLAKDKVSEWDGVRNYQARNNMAKMQLNDVALFYHSVTERKVVGLCQVCKLFYPDYTDGTGKFGMVDFKYIDRFENPVSLSDIKANEKLSNIALIKQSRLSVIPLTEDEIHEICIMAKFDLISVLNGSIASMGDNLSGEGDMTLKKVDVEKVKKVTKQSKKSKLTDKNMLVEQSDSVKKQITDENVNTTNTGTIKKPKATRVKATKTVVVTSTTNEKVKKPVTKQSKKSKEQLTGDQPFIKDKLAAQKKMTNASSDTNKENIYVANL